MVIFKTAKSVNVGFDTNIVQGMETKLYSISLRVCADEESKISVIGRARGRTYEGCCD